MEKNEKILEYLKKHPVIATVRTKKEINDVIKSKVKIVFVLNASILDVCDVIKKLKENFKIVFLHLDLVTGLSYDESALEYITKICDIDGILTTKKSLILKANKLGLVSIFRIFAIDSSILASTPKFISNIKPSFIEILPGIAPKSVKLLSKRVSVPIITGGLVEDINEVKENLEAGAVGVSTSCANLWE